MEIADIILNIIPGMGIPVMAASVTQRARGRFAMVVALFVLSMITYIARACISGAKEPMAASLRLSDIAMGYVFGAFALGYALAQVPAGWIADCAGPRLALVSIVTLWSVFTALTGASDGLTSLIAIRLLFGISEAGAFPSAARAIRNWLPAGGRGRANGVLFSGSRMGAAVSFPLFAWILASFSWRYAFVVLGCAGVVWALLWLLFFRDSPGPALRLSAPLTASRQDLRRVFLSRPLALAMVQCFASDFTFFIGLSWMLHYLRRQFDMPADRAAVYAMAPLLAGACAQWVSGWMVAALYRPRFHAWSRRGPAILGFVLAACGLLALTQATTPGHAVACFTFAVFDTDMTVSPSWVFCAEMAGANAAGVSGAMNMVGNLGSFVSAGAFPVPAAATGAGSAYFAVAAALNMVGAVCWMFARRATEEDKRSAA
jgi:ACS family glucarate transporter-like MFS transporter